MKGSTLFYGKLVLGKLNEMSYRAVWQVYTAGMLVPPKPLLH